MLNRHIQASYLVQNFTSILVNPLIFAVSFVLWVKNAFKVDQSENKFFWSNDFQWVLFVSVFLPDYVTYSKDEWVHQTAGEILYKIACLDISVQLCSLPVKMSCIFYGGKAFFSMYFSKFLTFLLVLMFLRVFYH